MKSGSPFFLVPWQEDFLQALLRLALDDTGGDISRAVFIFPHIRPGRYLTLLLQQESSVKRPLIMPRMLTVSALFSDLAGKILARPAWNAGLLDRVGLLLACARAEASGSENADIAPFLTDARRFFPWGARLASLFEECFIQHRKPDDFLHVEDQVSPFAALLLSRLGRIFRRYETALKEREWTSPGLDASLTADLLCSGRPLPENALPGSPGAALYIAGFHTLTGTENILFRHLWEHQGARVVWHADPALTSDAGASHWSCKAFSAWAKKWGVRPELFSLRQDSRPESAKRIRYFAGFDLHSQLAVMSEELSDLSPIFPSQEITDKTEPFLSPASPADILEQAEEEDWEEFSRLADPLGDHRADTLVALPDNGLLMPVLHHLPHVDVNISMGYPLTRSPLFRLVDTLIRLQESRRNSGYYWRDLVDLIRHPYLKTLRPAAAGTGNAAAEEDPRVDSSAMLLRRELHRLEEYLRAAGRKYTDPRALVRGDNRTGAHFQKPPAHNPGSRHQQSPQSPENGDAPCARRTAPPQPRPDGFSGQPDRTMLLPGGQPDPLVHDLLEGLFQTTLTAFETLETTTDLAAALENLCAFLLAHGRHLWKRFPIDAECLYRLRQSLIPELALSELAGEKFTTETLFAILRSLLDAERVPFEAAPLVGLQVMGMLETRLLSFRRVVIMDATEDSLPGSPAGDPLLPEALRPELGLPPLHSREQVAAYTFFRLVAGAEEIVVLWQEGGDVSAAKTAGEQKKRKSRFVEELLWEEEKRLGRLLAAQGKDGPLTVIESAAAPIPKGHQGIPVTAPVRDLINDLLKKPVSASLLDSYLGCPVRFFHERLVRLAPADEVIEGNDPLAVGNLFHEVLQEGYAAFLNVPLPGGEALAEQLEQPVLNTFFASPSFLALARSLPADSSAMIAVAAEKRLKDYFLNQPATTVLALETPLHARFCHGSGLGAGQWSLTGKADRIDLRPMPGIPDSSAIVILDYKTGHLPVIGETLWEDSALWRRLQAWEPAPPAPGDSRPEGDRKNEPPDAGPDPLLADLAARLESVQLPFYLLLYSLMSRQGMLLPMPGALFAPQPPARGAMNAAWVSLGSRGEEISLFPKNFSLELRREIVEKRIPELVYFLLRHIQKSTVLLPRPGKHCDWCFSAKLCRVPAASV